MWEETTRALVARRCHCTEEARANLKEAVALVLEANRALAWEDGAGADVIRESLKVCR